MPRCARRATLFHRPVASTAYLFPAIYASCLRDNIAGSCARGEKGDRGSAAQLDTMHVNITEYTVGESGPEAMPALLPPSVLYEY